MLLIRACPAGDQVRLGSVWGGTPSHDLLVALSFPHRPFLSVVLIYLLYLRALKTSEASFVLVVIGSRRDKRIFPLRTRRRLHKILQTSPS